MLSANVLEKTPGGGLVWGIVKIENKSSGLPSFEVYLLLTLLLCLKTIVLMDRKVAICQE